MTVPTAVKIKLKCGDDDFCVVKEYKVMFTNNENKVRYINDQRLLLDILKKNQLLSDELYKDNIDISVVRDISVPLEKWRDLINSHKPDGKSFDEMTEEDKLKYIAKYNNRHPTKSPLTDHIVFCS